MRKPKWSSSIYFLLISFISLSCSVKRKEIKKDNLYLDYIQLDRNEIEEGHVYFSANYVLYSYDTVYSSFFSCQDLRIDTLDISLVKTLVVKAKSDSSLGPDFIRKYFLTAFVNGDIEKDLFQEIIHSSIKSKNIYLRNNEDSVKLKVSNRSKVFYTPSYQPR